MEKLIAKEIAIEVTVIKAGFSEKAAAQNDILAALMSNVEDLVSKAE